MKRIFLVVVMIATIIEGCTKLSSSPSTILPEKNTPEIPTDFAGDFGTSTPAAISSPTSNGPSRPALFKKCLQVEGGITLAQVATGTVLLDEKDDSSMFLLDLESGNRHELPFRSDALAFFGTAVSPDGNNLAYVENIYNGTTKPARQRIWIVDATGQVQATKTTYPEILSSEWNWLDNRMIEFQSRVITWENGSIILYDPFSQDWRYFSDEIPDFYNFQDRSMIWWLVDYSPDLSVVAYLGRMDDGGPGVIVRDLVTKVTIWKAPGLPYGIPRWSPAEDQIAVVMSGQLYLVDKTSRIIQFPELAFGNDILNLSWSPNGQYIALWAGHDERMKADLMIYDTKASQVVDFCLTDNGRYNGFPVWSPDSRQFVVKMFLDDSGISQPSTVLVDIQNNAAYEISDDKSPLEWMNSIP
jgi:dipeptidyl aminopeptidase/acylaminoacyl peptidase